MRSERYLLGIDGGGTSTTLALVAWDGREVLRRTGPAGIVDPRRPLRSAELLARLAREILAEAGLTAPVAAMCAGVAGAGNTAEREAVRAALEREGIARRVLVLTDGAVALEGALEGRAGILLVAGTGSVAYCRAEDGAIARCGGWGMVAGDEGSAYWMGRAALAGALRSVDGRGPETGLLARLLNVLGLAGPEAIPAWAGRAEKGDIGALALPLLELAHEGDAVAGEVVRAGAVELAAHVAALVRRLGPWKRGVVVVLHGGVARHPVYRAEVERALHGLEISLELREPTADPATGAVRLARAAAE